MSLMDHSALPLAFTDGGFDPQPRLAASRNMPDARRDSQRGEPGKSETRHQHGAGFTGFGRRSTPALDRIENLTRHCAGAGASG